MQVAHFENHYRNLHIINGLIRNALTEKFASNRNPLDRNKKGDRHALLEN